MADRTVIVTGASSGIGLETARALAQKGARIVLVVRSEERGKAAMEDIRATVPTAALDLVLADLYSLAEVRRAAKEIRDRYDRVDVLVNNAGLIHREYQRTVDGFERTFALNHLAPFLFTYELRELLARSAPARVVTVSSGAHAVGRLDWDDLAHGAKGYSETIAYGTSKLCNILFAREASRRFAGKGVTSNSLHPGLVGTNFGASGSFFYRVGIKIIKPLILTSEQGSRTSVHLASSPEVEGVTGEYFVKKRRVRPSSAASSEDNAARLWRISEKLCEISW